MTSANLQERDFKDLRAALFGDCAVSVRITREETSVQLQGVLAKMKYEDVDKSAGFVYENYVDVLFYGDSGYEPQIGDVLRFAGINYVVRPVSKEVWRWDDPYQCVLRVHAQRSGV